MAPKLLGATEGCREASAYVVGSEGEQLHSTPAIVSTTAMKLNMGTELFNSSIFQSFNSSIRLQPFYKEVVVPVGVTELRTQDGGVGCVVAHA